jgi:hypothetical protein
VETKLKQGKINLPRRKRKNKYYQDIHSNNYEEQVFGNKLLRTIFGTKNNVRYSSRGLWVTAQCTDIAILPFSSSKWRTDTGS